MLGGLQTVGVEQIPKWWLFLNIIWKQIEKQFTMKLPSKSNFKQTSSFDCSTPQELSNDLLQIIKSS